MPKYQAKPCERCGREWAVRGNRFCSGCRKVVLQELENAGYLTKRIGKPTYRDRDKREELDYPNPWQENAVRALEDG